MMNGFRLGRGQFFAGVVAVVFAAAVVLLATRSWTGSPLTVQLLGSTAFVVLIVGRLHDLGWSSWWVVAYVIPQIVALVVDSDVVLLLATLPGVVLVVSCLFRPGPTPA
jgi:uncharacterized membrane protein YhaH (DUF805 family)